MKSVAVCSIKFSTIIQQIPHFARKERVELLSQRCRIFRNKNLLLIFLDYLFYKQIGFWIYFKKINTFCQITCIYPCFSREFFYHQDFTGNICYFNPICSVIVNRQNGFYGIRKDFDIIHFLTGNGSNIRNFYSCIKGIRFGTVESGNNPFW